MEIALIIAAALLGVSIYLAAKNAVDLAHIHREVKRSNALLAKRSI